MNLETQADATPEKPKPLTALQRRILGVLMEKARTTPDAYPLSLNGLVTGANQKSNRHPIMNLTHEEVEEELITMRDLGIVSEIHGGGRVPKYRHFGSDYMGVKSREVGVMVELLLRGEQTLGELRTRASRFEPIADVGALTEVLRGLIDRELVVSLTPPGRGQVVTHGLYEPDELDELKRQFAGGAVPQSTARAAPARRAGVSESDLEAIREELSELRQTVERLADRIDRLEG